MSQQLATYDAHWHEPNSSHQRRHCPLCQGARQFRPVRFNLLSCTDCGLVVSPDFWTPQLDRCLEDKWFGENWDPAASIWVRCFETLGNRNLFNRLRFLPQGGSMLEVGFGSGSFLAFMQSRGWTVEGCDLSGQVCRQAAKRWGVRTHWGDVASLPKNKRYDLVIANHVLEHAQHPRAMLEDIRARMTPGGLLHVSVPNYDCWDASLSGWIGYQPYHFIYFTPKTLSKTIASAGLNIESAATHAQFACWFQTVLATIVPRLRGKTRKTIRDGLSRRPNVSAIMHAYRAATAIFGIVSWPVRRLQERLGDGTEAFVLARRSS